MFNEFNTYVFSLRKLHRNVNSSLDRLSTFIFTEWKFKNDKTLELQKWLSPVDQKDFQVDITSMVWIDLFDNLTQGARRYLNKESMRNIEAARGKDTL